MIALFDPISLISLRFPVHLLNYHNDCNRLRTNSSEFNSDFNAYTYRYILLFYTHIAKSYSFVCVVYLFRNQTIYLVDSAVIGRFHVQVSVSTFDNCHTVFILDMVEESRIKRHSRVKRPALFFTAVLIEIG